MVAYIAMTRVAQTTKYLQYKKIDVLVVKKLRQDGPTDIDSVN